MSNALDEVEREERELEASGTMEVRITKCTGDSWYSDRIGEVYTVYKKPVECCGGPGYKCIDILGGITVTDCEVVG